MIEDHELKDGNDAEVDGGGGVDNFNLSLIHWAVKHNNRRLLER